MDTERAAIGALTDMKLRSLKLRTTVYQVADGDGLMLEARPSGQKAWLYRYRLLGRAEKLASGTRARPYIDKEILPDQVTFILKLRNPKRAWLGDAWIHGLRRTASTRPHEMGWASDVIEKALNHTAGGGRDVYNRAQYAEQRREMLQAWADAVDAYTAGASNVITGKLPVAA